MDNLEGTMGFTRVIQRITESGKLVVGHNMLLDVAFTLNQFAAPLPTDYSEFKVNTILMGKRLRIFRWLHCYQNWLCANL